jgi:hypothetical protein
MHQDAIVPLNKTKERGGFNAWTLFGKAETDFPQKILLGVQRNHARVAHSDRGG